MRRSGILMHITSLPGPGGIGTMGDEAYKFADFLKKSGMKIWQVLPIGPVGYGESPYQSTSTFAGNPMMISIEYLRRDGLLTCDDSDIYVPSVQDKVEFDAVRASKDALLRKAFAQSGEKCAADVEAFTASHAWAEDYALFTAVKAHFDKAMWTKWPDKAIRMREPEAIKAYREKLDEEVRYQLFLQWLFFKQWFALKTYCNENGISIFGDIPIYVAEDSADTWTHPEVFQLDKDRKPTHIAGVPPDIFSEDGQRWGNPLYNWTYLKKDGFTWWVDRMRAVSTMYDIIRVDHFIGFANYYSIPASCETARVGKWVNAPGSELFKKLKAELPEMNVIAEDLGNLTPRVLKLLKEVGYPGMKVMSFAFPHAKGNPHNLENMTENYVAYTGTHDNDTLIGWWDKLDEEVREEVRKELHILNDKEVAGAFMTYLFKSKCDTVIMPMQDILALPGSARMNMPSTIGSNWGWRMLPKAIKPEIPLRLKILNKESDRL